VEQFLGSAYGEVSPDGEAHFPVVAAKIGELMTTEPHEDIAELGKIRARSLVMFSDDDLMTLEHAVAMFRLLGGGVLGDLAPMPPTQFAVLPGTSHIGVTGRADMLMTMIPPFLDAP
jgi:hypothetical protein